MIHSPPNLSRVLTLIFVRRFPVPISAGPECVEAPADCQLLSLVFLTLLNFINSIVSQR